MKVGEVEVLEEHNRAVVIIAGAGEVEEPVTAPTAGSLRYKGNGHRSLMKGAEGIME